MRNIISKIFCAVVVLTLARVDTNALDFEKEAKDSGLEFMNFQIDPNIKIPVAKIDSSMSNENGEILTFKLFGDDFKNPVYPEGIDDRGLVHKSISNSEIDTEQTKLSCNVGSCIKLNEIINAYLRPNSLFLKTRKGTVVYISATTTTDCPDGKKECADYERYFVALTVNRVGTYFIKGTEIANVLFIRGSKDIVIDNDIYRIKLYVKLSSLKNSIVEIERQEDGLTLRYTGGQIQNLVGSTGVDVMLSKHYKLAYGNEIVQSKGSIKFTNRMLIALAPFPPNFNKREYYLLDVSKIKPSGVIFQEIDKNFGFRILDGILQIYPAKY